VVTPRGAQLQRSLALTLQLLAEHEKVSPTEVDQIFAMLVAHIRSARPMALLTGGVL
jgi:hypothetical protein